MKENEIVLDTAGLLVALKAAVGVDSIDSAEEFQIEGSTARALYIRSTVRGSAAIELVAAPDENTLFVEDFIRIEGLDDDELRSIVWATVLGGCWKLGRGLSRWISIGSIGPEDAQAKIVRRWNPWTTTPDLDVLPAPLMDLTRAQTFRWWGGGRR